MKVNIYCSITSGVTPQYSRSLKTKSPNQDSGPLSQNSIISGLYSKIATLSTFEAAAGAIGEASW